MNTNHFYLYRIYYGETIVYIGRTKQQLPNRIRGHLFSKPMHRTIHIEQVSKIEYAVCKSESDMNLYEIYYILKIKPALNVDDKAKDELTIELPALMWAPFETPLWEKWRSELAARDTKHDRLFFRYKTIPEELSVLRSTYREGNLTDEEFANKRDSLKEEQESLRKLLWE